MHQILYFYSNIYLILASALFKLSGVLGFWGKLVYLDEFHISMHQKSIYSWSKKGTVPIVAVNPSSFVITFMVEFSNERIEEILTSNHSIKSKSFSIFLINLWKSLKNDDNLDKKVCIIFDNFSVHKKQDWLDLMIEHRRRRISIPSYSLQLNAAEKLITVTKHKIKNEWMNSKLLSLQSIKRIIDEISTETLRK